MTIPPSAPFHSDPLLTVQQVADFLGTSLRTMQRRIADGSIHTLKLGRIVRIPASEIGRLLDRDDDRNPKRKIRPLSGFVGAPQK